jgi:site-specific DNA-methyltransferase (adenine-specific)
MKERYNTMSKIQLIHGDCLEEMDKLIKQGVKVDAIITDPPYGTTACKWDSVIPFNDMWQRLNKLVKPNGAIVLFGSQPFTSALIMSNPKMFKYEWIWEKDKPTNFALANKQPMKYHENILVFYTKQPTYNKQLEPRKGSGSKRYKYPVDNSKRKSDHNDIQDDIKMFDPKLKNPSSIQVVSTGRRQDLIHPTQKPIALMEYLIKTYSNEGETVLDFCMGSGTTGVACKTLNRNFIGIELDKKYFEIAKARINKKLINKKREKKETKIRTLF